MKNIGIVPIKIGSGRIDQLLPVRIAFYSWFASIFLPINGKYEVVNSRKLHTVPINLTDEDAKEFTAYSKVKARLEEWSNKADICIIDVETPFGEILPGKIDYQIMQAIDAFLNFQSKEKPKLLILICQHLPPDDEALRKSILNKHITDGRMAIIDETGDYITSFKTGPSFDKKQFNLRLINARDRYEDLLERKMIRRLGHFHRVSDYHDPYCVRYFYDGKDCENEISELIVQYITEQFKNDDAPLILYHCEISDWLIKPICVAARSINSDCFHIDDYLKNYNNHKSLKDKVPLIIVPLVDTTETLRQLVIKWEQICATEPMLLSILCTEGDLDRNGSRVIEIDGGKHILHYFMKVERTKYIDNCPLCKLRIPKSSLDHEDYLMITSYDMWDIADKAGWIPEPKQEIPGHRGKGLKWVPKFVELIHQNGSWVARKVVDRISFETGIDPSTKLITIVCKDETPVNALANYLEVIQGVTVISIPKKVMKEVSAKKADIQNIVKKHRKKEELWCMQLESLSPRQPMIIIEEYSVTGGTKLCLADIIMEYGYKPICHFTLMDFHMNLENIRKIPSYSLYELQLGFENA